MNFLADRPRGRRIAVGCAIAALSMLTACNAPQPPASRPVEFTRDTPCSVDGMTLADYPGPKAQIVHDQGAPDFFCDTVELLAVLLGPAQKGRVGVAYVQDMARTAWDNPREHWIDARSAVYVAGSKLHGSMGPTLASFASEADARAFAAAQGGKVYRFAEITPDMVVLDGGVLKDRQM